MRSLLGRKAAWLLGRGTVRAANEQNAVVGREQVHLAQQQRLVFGGAAFPDRAEALRAGAAPRPAPRASRRLASARARTERSITRCCRGTAWSTRESPADATRACEAQCGGERLGRPRATHSVEPVIEVATLLVCNSVCEPSVLARAPTAWTCRAWRAPTHLPAAVTWSDRGAKDLHASGQSQPQTKPS